MRLIFLALLVSLTFGFSAEAMDEECSQFADVLVDPAETWSEVNTLTTVKACTPLWTSDGLKYAEEGYPIGSCTLRLGNSAFTEPAIYPGQLLVFTFDSSIWDEDGLSTASVWCTNITGLVGPVLDGIPAIVPVPEAPSLPLLLPPQ